MWTVKFNLEAALQNNGVIEGDVEEVIKKQLDNAPKHKDDEKKNDANYRINTTDVDLTFSRIKLLLTLVEFKWEKVIILRLLLTPRACRVALVCPHSISVSVIISYTNVAAISHVKLRFLKSKANSCWILTLSWRKS